jgi:hypothetical protein
MIRKSCKYMLLFGIATVAWAWNGQIYQTVKGDMVASAEAVVGRPATPVSYAGVARRSTVGAGAPGVGVTPGVGVGAPGAGAAPMNMGGPVNRVGRR